MKRKAEEDLPPAKKRKIDESDPCVIIPNLKISCVSNGIVQIAFLNIDSYYEQEINNQDVYQFELMYKRNNNEWKIIQYLNHEIACYEYFYLKVLVDIQDYTLQFKLRSKLKDGSVNKWSSYCEIIKIKIPSSLIAHQFKVGDYVEFRAKNEYYSREGRIIKHLSDNHVQIRPFPNHHSTQSNHNTNNDNNDMLLQHTAADLNYYFFPFDDNDNDHDTNYNEDEQTETDSDNDSEDDDVMMNMLHSIIHNNNNNNNNNPLKNLLLRKNKNRNDINVHYSRLYGDGIRLSAVIDISDNQINVDKMILLRSNNNEIVDIYNTLNEIYYDYAVKMYGNYNQNQLDIDGYQLKYIGRCIGKNVCDFLLDNDEQRLKWKIGCLRESNDGKMNLNGVRSDIISARIDGLKHKIDGMKLYDIDSIIGFCDLCRLEISDYDWRYTCDQQITNKHDICMTCTYNVINQYMQVNGLLYPLLTSILNNDCIQEITSFVVGSVVRL